MTENPFMNSHLALSNLLSDLGYSESPGLVSDDNVPEALELSWQEAKDKLQIDAIYFIANAPVIYFKQFEIIDQTRIIQLHRNVWNQSKVPLLFVILPSEVRVYNGYEAPRQINGELIEPSRLDELFAKNQDLQALSLWGRLAVFARNTIDSGAFWKEHAKHFNPETKADQRLIANLREVRKQLLKTSPKLSTEHAHSLIGRSIFALYLQDRGVLTIGEDGFFAQQMGRKYERYVDLLDSHEATYRFFEILRDHFNGDMFPVTVQEKEEVRLEHLQLLKNLFTVDWTTGGQMLFFWAYNFEFIPIELISAIYEEFLHQEESGGDGAYYTRPMLVDFMLGQVMHTSFQNENVTLLDPACGSGIFLVEAYKRLIERWRKTHGQKPNISQLIDLLKGSIFGVDIKRQALRVAAFSLYLAMLDYIEPKSIWMEVHFPPLIGTNLIESDFFDAELHFTGRQFDLVIGNPPWMSKLTPSAREYLRSHKYKVGDKQIVQAFLWRAPDFCVPQGQIAFLCSSKSLLFNKSHPNAEFRHNFFKTFSVSKIFDFSALRRFLFEKGIAPAAAIFFAPHRPDPTASIFYGAPKLTPQARRLAALIMESTDLKQLPQQQVWESLDRMYKSASSPDPSLSLEQDNFFDDKDEIEETAVYPINIWKIALWGNSYDYLLLQIFSKFPSLLQVISSHGWESGSGFIRNGPGKSSPVDSPWLAQVSFLDAEHFTRYGIDKGKIVLLPEEARKYHRGRRPEIFFAPLVLFKRGQEQRRPAAAYIDHNCTYTNAVTGITGPEQDRHLLKALTALLNSEFAQYYLFLTNPSWGVEREEILAGDIYTLPFPFLEEINKSRLLTIAALVDTLADLSASHSSQEDNLSASQEQTKRMDALEKQLDQEIYACLGLSEQETQHIQETVQYTIDFFNHTTTSLALEPPSVEMCKKYAKSYLQSMNFYLEPAGKKITSDVFYLEPDRKKISDISNPTASIPLCTIRFSLKDLEDQTPDVQAIKADQSMQEALTSLQRLSTEKFSETFYLKRDFKLYEHEGTVFYITKPSERRYWTIGAALSDVEEAIAEFM
jgi:methylase of polypeptide subunit release factors